MGYLGSFVKGNQVGIRLNPIDWQGALLLQRWKQELPPNEGNALYQDPCDGRLWKLICWYKNNSTKRDIILKHISSAKAKVKYSIDKIQSNETVIDSDWRISSNHLTREDAFEVQKRIYVLTTNYLEKLIDKGWEALYIDHNDNRFWELTYPKSEMQGGGPPLLKNIDKNLAFTKYGIDIISK